MTNRHDGPVARWLQRPFFTHRKYSIGPRLTNFGALVLAGLLSLPAVFFGVMYFVA